MSDYNFTQTIITSHYEIKLAPADLYGYFEHLTKGDNSAGGLWFERLEGGLIGLTDYDGVFALPTEVKQALIETGCIVDEDF